MKDALRCGWFRCPKVMEQLLALARAHPNTDTTLKKCLEQVAEEAARMADIVSTNKRARLEE
jgi:hypothetical protein